MSEENEKPLSKREWTVLRDALGLPDYWRSEKTCQKLTDKGLMKKNPVMPCYYVTEAGRELIAKANALQARIMESS